MKQNVIPDFDRTNWPLPDEFLLELGRLTALWTSLEDQLHILIGRLAGFGDLFDMRPFILVKHSSFQQKIDILSSLCEHLMPKYPHLRNYQEVVAQIRAVQSLRNRYVHNGLVVSEDGSSVEMPIGSARGKLKTSIEKVTIDDIKKVSVEIARTMKLFHLLVTGHDRPAFWEKGST